MADGLILKPDNYIVNTCEVSDLNDAIEPNKVCFVRSTQNTLNTPYKAGLSGVNVAGITMSYAGFDKQFGIQLSFATGRNEIFERTLSAGTWSSWRKL